MHSRRSFLALAGGAVVPLSGCSRGPRDVIHVAPVERVTLGGGEPADLPSLPESLPTAVANVLRRNAAAGSWRLDDDPTEGAVARSLSDPPIVVTRGRRYHLEGVYAEFEADVAEREIHATAVFPATVPTAEGVPAPHLFDVEDLSEDVRAAVETAIEDDSHADLGDSHEYTDTVYDGTYVRVDGDVYRTSVETLA